MSAPTNTKSEQIAKREAALATGLNRAARRALGLRHPVAVALPAAPVPAHPTAKRHTGCWRADDLALRPGEFAAEPVVFKKPAVTAGR